MVETETEKLKRISRNEYFRQYMKNYRKDHPDKIKKSRDDFNKNHPDYYKTYAKQHKPICQDQKSDPGQKQGDDQNT